MGIEGGLFSFLSEENDITNDELVALTFKKKEEADKLVILIGQQWEELNTQARELQEKIHQKRNEYERAVNHAKQMQERAIHVLYPNG